MENYLSFVILSALHKINTERTIYSIYHLLKGKKSSQTIQDAHLFQLTNIFHTFPHLSRIFFEETVQEFEQLRLVKRLDGDRYEITDRGLEILSNKVYIPKFVNGWKFYSIQDHFWKRLSLIVQVGSNLINHESSYIPIQNDMKVVDWLKSTLSKVQLSREYLAKGLLNELGTCLSSENDINPNVLVLRLSGYKNIGLTPLQVAEALEMDPSYLQIEFLNVIHYMIEKILSNTSEYPILQNLLVDFHKPVILTQSSSITYKYLSMGYTIDEIAAARNLKSNTIEDHIVEIALNDPSLSLEPFVKLDIQNSIKTSIKRLSSKQLKKIRQDLNNTVSYFQIRLVLARFGDQL
ncbi:helix-turn-helix domain-containing protein [Neobacillus sp. D3-1R]|uniref:helix-turn-helix domain-containing protein n=1 Tax=Neobacillus sp. D3-1R TaxID=3445778 RepID=UPI003F9FBD1F